MPSLIIPKEHFAGLAQLRQMTPAQTNWLAGALSTIPPTAESSSDIITMIGAQAAEQGLTGEAVQGVIGVLYSLYHVRALADALLEEFVVSVIDAMRASGNDAIMLDETERDNFASRLKTLLAVDQVILLARANALQRDHEHIFHDAKILTDLRPVFHDVSQQPKHFVIQHTLKIIFHDGSKHEEVYMALDLNDLKRLRAVIDRAEKKAVSLKALLKGKELTLVGETK